MKLSSDEAEPKPDRPQFGALKDEQKWPDGWDAPLSESEADAFWDGRWELQIF